MTDSQLHRLCALAKKHHHRISALDAGSSYHRDATSFDVAFGKVIAFLCDSRRLTPQDASRAIDVADIKVFEIGDFHLLDNKLYRLKDALRLNDGEWNEVSQCYWPALNPQWLDKQPKNKAGLYLNALRRRSGITEEALGEAMNVSKQMVDYWESGDNNIPAHRIDELMQKLGGDSAETRRLLYLRLPPLDPAWPGDSQYPQNELAGQLMAAYRELKGWTQNEFFRYLNVGNNSYKVSLCERGLRPIPDAWIENMPALFGLDAAQESRFRRICRASDAPSGFVALTEAREDICALAR